MKKLILVAALALIGCDKADKYSDMPILLPSEVVELHKVCRTQPDYRSSRVIVRDSSARSVICTYRDTQPSIHGGPTLYEVDAKVLKIKIQEGLK